MARTTDARGKALATAERLFRIQGFAATGLTQILEESGAPKGSFYFHFPDGKVQLAREVLRAYSARIEAFMRDLAARKGSDPDRFVSALCQGVAREMQAGNWETGCAAQVLANELAPTDEQMADLLEAVFASWSSIVADVFETVYPSRRVAERRATALIAALEGARTLARATRSAAPFDAVAEQFRSAMPAASKRGSVTRKK